MIAGCTPSISPKERTQMEQAATPYERDTSYQQALLNLGNVVNKGIDATSVLQTKQVVNKTDQKGIPIDVTDMVISSTNNLAGDLLRIVPYDPQYIDSELKTGGGFTRSLPTLVIDGAITEYDQNISLKERGLNIQVYAPIKLEDKTTKVAVPDKDGNYTTVEINTGSKQIDADVGFDFSKTDSISRISVDFHLMDYATLAYLPKKHVTSTILVCTLEKSRRMSFIIYGSGLSLWGKIMESQGTHQAVRTLIDYSMLHLLSSYYHLPYWRALGFETHPKAQELLAAWRQEFLKLGTDAQGRDLRVLRLQSWLTKYDLGEVYVGNTLANMIPESEYGQFGAVTQALTLKFLYQYAPESRLVSYVENNGTLTPDMIADFYVLLIEHVPM